MSAGNGSREVSLAALSLRIGLGIVTITEGWLRTSHSGELISLWYALHLPGPPILGRGLEIALICSGMLLVVGLLTRFMGLFVALVMFAEILATKAPHANFQGWTTEWQSFWMALGLVACGAGSASLDTWIRKRRDALV